MYFIFLGTEKGDLIAKYLRVGFSLIAWAPSSTQSQLRDLAKSLPSRLRDKDDGSAFL